MEFLYGLHQALTLTPLIMLLFVLENKTNATSNPNIGLLKIAIEEEWNKMSEEFILKVCWYNNWKRTTILSKFTVLYLFSYFVIFFRIKIDLVL